MKSPEIRDLLNIHLNTTYPLSVKMVDILYDKMNTITLVDRELLLNNSAKNVFILISGALKVYSIKDGIEKIAKFVEPGSFVNISSQSRLRSTVTTYIEAIEKCVVLSISREELECLYSSSLEFANWGRVYVEREMTEMEYFFSHIFFLSPEEMYEDVMQSMNPALLQKIPQKQLASYLNLAPESLSRIRRRLHRRRLGSDKFPVPNSDEQCNKSEELSKRDS